MWEDKGLPSSALKLRAQKKSEAGKQQQPPAVSVFLEVWVKSQKLVFRLHLSPHLICCFLLSSVLSPLPVCRLSSSSLIFSPSCWIEYSRSTESIRLGWWPLHIVASLKVDCHKSWPPYSSVHRTIGGCDDLTRFRATFSSVKSFEKVLFV